MNGRIIYHQEGWSAVWTYAMVGIGVLNALLKMLLWLSELVLWLLQHWSGHAG